MRYYHALIACQSASFAKTEETFNLLGHASHGLYFSLLINRACNRDALIDGKFGKAREYCV